MRIVFSKPALPKSGAVILLATEDKAAPRLTPAGRSLDKTLGGAIGRALGATRF